MKIPHTAKPFQYPLPHELYSFNLRHYSLLSQYSMLSITIYSQAFLTACALDSVVPPGISALPYHHAPPVKSGASTKKVILVVLS